MESADHYKPFEVFPGMENEPSARARQKEPIPAAPPSRSQGEAPHQTPRLPTAECAKTICRDCHIVKGNFTLYKVQRLVEWSIDL